jgi:hypothetical protein
MKAPDDDLPELVISDQDQAVLALLGELQRAVLVHSEAARALFGTLAEEGRLYAQTPAGARWKERLRRSALLERALIVWQSATLWMSEDAEPGQTPSAVIDAVAAAARSPRRDELLDRLFREGQG